MAEDSPTSSDAAPALTPFAARLARISNRPRSASSGAPSTSTPASLGSWRSRLVRPAPESPINESPAYATADDDAAAPTFPAVAAPAPGKEEAPRPVAAPITRPAASATAKPRASRATRPLPSLAARAAVSVPAPLTEPAPLAEPAALARPVVLAEPATADEAEPHLNATPSHDAPSPEAAPNDECSAEGDEPKDGDEPKKDPGVLNWGFIIPRVAAVAGVALLLTIFAGSIVAFGLQAVGERIVRAKVDLGETDASWIDARVELKEVAVANRRRPGKNLFSFTDGVLDFDAFKLLSGQYIIDEAKLSGLRFDTDRDDDGRSDFVRLRDIDIPLPEIDLKDLGLDRLKKALGSFSLKGVAAVQERIEQEVLKT
ncbi:MAG TPA: hypothetical protein VGE52_17490, partial [Pirellulales bacterium]